MGKRVSILQSNYIPWKGYFDIINAVDEFIIYDDMQYTKNDWRNRNKIKTSQGVQWLTVPVKVESLSQLIRETSTATDIWRSKHAKTLSMAYSKSRCFREVWPVVEPLYAGHGGDSLSDINFGFIAGINRFLGITTKLTWSSDYQLAGDRNERLIGLCRQAGADEYITGPSALDYMDPAAFGGAGIKVKVVDYSAYPEYAQPHPPFEHAVSILDLLFSEGADARKYMKTFPESQSGQPFLREAFA